MSYNNRQPLYIQIYSHLKERINSGSYKIGSTIPTEKELTDEFSVSRITIQKAIKLLVDDGLVLRKSGVGTFVTSAEQPEEKKKLIGLILPGLLPSFGQTLLNAIESECTKRGYYLVLKISHESQTLEWQCTDDLLNMPVDGLLVEPVQKRFYNSLLTSKILAGEPIVIMDKALTGIDSMLVSSDHFQGALDAANYIADHGHSSIGILTYKSITNSTLEKRVNAFRQVCSNREIPFTEKNVARVVTGNYFRSQETQVDQADIEEIKSFILSQKLTCIVVLDSYLAVLAKYAINQLHLQIPTDISLFGFDSSETFHYGQNYTHLDQDENLLGKESVDLLVEYMENESVKRRERLFSPTIEDFGTVKKVN